MPSGVTIGFAAVCDATYRDEETGKAVLAGVFSGPIVVGSFPAVLQFAFYVEVYPEDSASRNLDLRFYHDGKLLGGVKAEAVTSPLGDPIVIATPVVAMQVAGPGTFELRLVVDKGRPIKVLKKTIRQRPSPAPSA